MSSPLSAERLRVSLAAPAYNEEANIEAAVREWSAWLMASPLVSEWEIVVANDGSTDRTAEILARLAPEFPQLRIVDLGRNCGAAYAITQAIKHTKLDWVLIIDSDRQFPITNLEAMILARAKSGKQAFSGARGQKADSFRYRFGSWASGALCNLFHGSRYRDFNSIFKFVEGPILRQIHLESRGMNCSTEITSRIHEMGIAWEEVPIEHIHRSGGNRSWKFIRGAWQRFLFVIYLGVRQAMLRQKVLQSPSPLS